MKLIKTKKLWTSSFEDVNSSFEDLETLSEFLAGGDVTAEEVNDEFVKSLAKVEALEFKRMLRNEEDQLSSMLEINPGAGGTESQDWAEMLMRIYIM